MPHFADRLAAAVRDKGAPICVGLDPVLEKLPGALRRGEPARAIEQFCVGVIDAVAEIAPCVKPQSACFERYGGAGVDAMWRVVEHARRRGLMTIVDAKRGDIGISAAHYAQAVAAADAVTVNPYLGDDALQPFIDAAASRDAGVFVLVRTSNPGSDALQTLELADGRPVCDAVASMVDRLGEAHQGASGYSLVGAVVGATKPRDAARLRTLMPRQWLLVPGFGAQGGSAQDVRACFDARGSGALITASRSVLYAFDAEDADWPAAVRAAAGAMHQQIGRLAASVDPRRS